MWRWVDSWGWTVGFFGEGLDVDGGAEEGEEGEVDGGEGEGEGCGFSGGLRTSWIAPRSSSSAESSSIGVSRVHPPSSLSSSAFGPPGPDLFFISAIAAASTTPGSSSSSQTSKFSANLLFLDIGICNADFAFL